MVASRNIVLAVLIALIALGVFYMLDPTLGGMLARKAEGFEDAVKEANALAAAAAQAAAPASVAGQPAGAFANSGEADKKKIEEAAAVQPHAGAAAPEGALPAQAGADVHEGFESPMPFAEAEKPANCYPKNQLSPQELLPNDPNSKWAQVNPAGAGDIAGKNFLNAGALIGVNTVGQSLRNASWDLRSEIPNPQATVSPWMTSTIMPDLQRRPLE
jgi:hypothetical protein